MDTPFVERIGHLARLAEIRGGAALADLRCIVAHLDRLSPSERDRFEEDLRAGRPVCPIGAERLTADLARLASGQADAVLDAARGALPALLRRLLSSETLTADEALALAMDAGVATLHDLDAALQSPTRLTALPASAAARIRAAAPALFAELRPIPLGRATDLLEYVVALLEKNAPGLLARSASGDARRFEPLVRTLSVAASAEHPARALEGFCSAPGVETVLHRATGRAVVVVQQTEVDVRIVTPQEYGARLFAATGTPGHLRAVRSRQRGEVRAAREEDVYAAAGLPWIAPELRQATGEFEAAAEGRLPRLITREAIRGDLHMHSTYSDGQDSLETMVRASLALGYEYIAITDHSERAAASRTVTLDLLGRQRDEIARLRERYPGITILHGIEVDILPDGRLDFPDPVLERLDIVLASLHDAAGQDGPALTRRCIQAIRHPLVNVITHPANQLVGRREGYPLDYQAIYDAAALAGTALEIDGAPSHLDLDGEHAREAIAAGVTVTIDSDCHRAGALRKQMTLGVGTARRGWVEARHVLNCRPLADVRAFIQAKRRV